MIRVQERQLSEVGHRLAAEHFEEAMIAHLRGFSPWQAEILGEAGMRAVIRLGVARAEAHRVTSADAVRFYLDLMLMFGSQFDTDPLVPWAGAILRDPGVADEAARMGRLHEALLAYRAAVNGAERSASLEALYRIRLMIRQRAPLAPLLTEQGAADALRSIHPRFCAYVGEPALLDLVARGRREAERLDVATDAGVVLVTALMFVIGHGFADDPLYPWVRVALAEGNPAARVARLGRQAEICLDRVMEPRS